MRASYAKSLFHILVFFSLLAALLGSAVSVTPAYAATLTVTKTADTNDGVCDSDCSLREAIAVAGPGDTIGFDGSLAGATIHLNSTLTLSQNVTIDGSYVMPPGVTISGDSNNDGSGDVRVFMVNNGVTATLNDLIIAKGLASGNTPADRVGGGIDNSGTLTVTGSLLVDNSATESGGGIYNTGTLTINTSTLLRNSSDGGGAISNNNTLTIFNDVIINNSAGSTGGAGITNAGTLTLSDTSFSGNSTTGDGGGIFHISGSATISTSTFANGSAQHGGGIQSNSGAPLNISNSTFSANTASNQGGGIYNGDVLTIANSTLSGNSGSSGGGIFNAGTLDYANTIIANSSGGDCDTSLGTLGTNTANLVEDGSCSAALNGDPKLDILDDNGGQTLTLALLPGSPAIDAGDATTCDTLPVAGIDQRFASRPVSLCDIGAFEYTPIYWVTKAADTNDGTCDSDCSLREAINAANAHLGGDTIRFEGDYTITLGSELPFITEDLTINGAGHTVVIDGANSYPVTEVQSSTVTLKHLTIRNASNGNGGAIINHFGLTVNDTTFSGNAASNNAGAIYNLGVLTVKNSTFANNSTVGGGGAIKNDNSVLTISNSTFAGNSAGTGGAIIALGASTTSITNSTFSGNTATTQAGGIYNNGTLNYANTIIANSTGGDCVNDGALGTNTNNLVEDGSCSAALSGDPSLGSLASNGGETQTFALTAGSTAINAGSNATCDVYPVYDIDQRGISRPNGLSCDIGAYEYVDSTSPTVTAFSAPSATASLVIPITTFTASDAIAMGSYEITTSSTPPAASDTSWTTSAPTTFTVGSQGNYTLYPWAKDAAGNVSAVYGSPASVNVDTTGPAVSSITLVNPNPSAKASVQFLATFSEAVTGVSTADFALTTSGGIMGASVSSVTGTGSTRTVTVLTGSGNGMLRLDVPGTATITDLVGNAITGLPYTGGAAYTINKTLIFMSTGSQDGWILESAETSSMGGALNATATTFRLGDDASRRQYLGVLSFNTGSLPDNATITAVMLKVRQQAIVGGGNPVTAFQGIMLDVKTGFLGTTTALQAADFQAAASKTLGPSMPTLTSGFYSFNLNPARTFINKLATNAGLTQIRLRFKLDDNNDAVVNYLSLFSGNAPVASRPQLIVTYYVP